MREGFGSNAPRRARSLELDSESEEKSLSGGESTLGPGDPRLVARIKRCYLGQLCIFVTVSASSAIEEIQWFSPGHIYHRIT